VASISPPGGPAISESEVLVTWLDPTPGPTADLPPGSPELASDFWRVEHTFWYFSDGWHDPQDDSITRNYTVTDYECFSWDDCTAYITTGSGSTPEYHWNGSEWTSGPTNYSGGRGCDGISDAYDVEQDVIVYPTAWDYAGRITEMQGEMHIVGYPNSTGDYYGCPYYRAVYSTVLTAV
jgi:hypothetical protein